MNKSLLPLLCVAAFGLTANAQAPETYEYLMINKLSPNGKWAFSEDPFNASFVIIDLETSECYGPYAFTGDDGFKYHYEGGMGNSISNDGIVLANTRPLDMDAAYWENGEWKWLPLLDDTTNGENNALGITPDGKRICGTITNPYTTYEIGNVCFPCIWERQEDGTYGKPVILPYPELDITNRIPSMTRVAYISEDGKTILGQMRDYSGYLHFPIVYREAADGTWSYELLHYNDLFLGDNSGIMPCPSEDELPEEVDAADYVDEDKVEAYREDYAKFLDGTGPWPNPGDYMSTQEQVDKYNEAVIAYNNAADEWLSRYDEFSQSFVEYARKVPDLIFNGYSMSNNGKYVLAAGADGDYIFNLETGEYRVVSDGPIEGMQITNDGTVLGMKRLDLDGYTRNANILLPGAYEYISLEEYFEPISEPTASWIKENLVRDMPKYKRDEYGYIMVDEEGYPILDYTVPTIVTGQACATDDLSVIATWTYDTWTLRNESNDYFSHVYLIDKTVGIGEIEVDTIEAPAVYYNLQGIRMSSESLAPGIYVKRQGQKVEKVYVK